MNLRPSAQCAMRPAPEGRHRPCPTGAAALARAALVSALVLVALLQAGCTGGEPSRPTITIVEHDWDAALILEHLLALVLEERLGFDVELVPVELVVAFAAMDRGDGSIDVAPDFWLPNQSDKWDRYVAPGSRETVLVNDRPYSGKQGFFVPGYVQDRHDIHSVADLADPEIAALFDSDGDGRGEYWVGPAGWNTVPINQLKAKAYGFDEFFDPLVIGEALFKSKLEADIAAEQGVLFYYWTPEWIHASYDLRLLEEPPYDETNGCWAPVLPEDDPAWMERGEVRCAYPDATIHVAYSKDLSERHPRAARFLRQVFFDPEDIDRWVLERAQEGTPARDIARRWLDENPEIVEQWLAGIDIEESGVSEQS